MLITVVGSELVSEKYVTKRIIQLLEMSSSRSLVTF